MKIRLLISNSDLELPDNLTISVVENSGLFDSEYLYGNIVYNISIINTPRNAALLQNPHIIHRGSREWMEFADCQLILFGKLKSVGTLCLTTIAKDQFAGILRDTNMDLLELLRDKKFADLAGVTTLTALDELTVQYEDDGSFKKQYEPTDKYCIFPVYNPLFYADRGQAYVKDDMWRDYEDIHELAHNTDSVPSSGNRSMLNFAGHDADYNYAINAIKEYCLNPIVPSIFAKHLLDIIGRYATYTVVFDSSIPSAFNYLAIFSNYDIAVPAFVETEGNTEMNFTNPVTFKVSTLFQTTGLKEFLLAFMGITNSFMRIDKIAHTITFYTKESIIDSTEVWNVSQKVRDLQLAKTDEKGVKFTYEISEDTSFAAMADLNDDLSLCDGDYNSLSDPYLLSYANKGRFYYDLFMDRMYRCVIRDDADHNLTPSAGANCFNRLLGLSYGSEPYKELALKMLPLLLDHSIFSGENMLFWDWKPCPYTLAPGNSAYFDEFVSDEVLRAMFYYFDGGYGRGVHERDGQSLILSNSTNGIYELLYRRWLYFLWKKASFTCNIQMSEREFNEFDVYRKLKIDESQAIIETITVMVHNLKGITGANVTAHFLPSDWLLYDDTATELGENDILFYYDLDDTFDDETGDQVCPNMANELRPLSISYPHLGRYNQYNGTDNYKEFDGLGNFGLLDFTICLNVKFSTIDTTKRFVINHSVWRIEISSDDGLRFIMGGYVVATIAGASITVGKWYVLIVKADRDGNITMELESGLSTSASITAYASVNLVNPNKLQFGCNVTHDDNFFHGGINNCIIVCRLCSDAEISAYKASYATPSDAQLLDKCDENGGAFNSINPLTEALVYGTLTNFHSTITVGNEEYEYQDYHLLLSWANTYGYSKGEAGMFYDTAGARAITPGTIIPRDESNPTKCCAYDADGLQLYLNRRGRTNQGLKKNLDSTYEMIPTPELFTNYDDAQFWFNINTLTANKLTVENIKTYYDVREQWDEVRQRFYIKQI
jgi:hypothetical protein